VGRLAADLACVPGQVVGGAETAKIHLSPSQLELGGSEARLWPKTALADRVASSIMSVSYAVPIDPIPADCSALKCKTPHGSQSNSLVSCADDPCRAVYLLLHDRKSDVIGDGRPWLRSGGVPIVGVLPRDSRCTRAFARGKAPPSWSRPQATG